MPSRLAFKLRVHATISLGPKWVAEPIAQQLAHAGAAFRRLEQWQQASIP